MSRWYVSLVALFFVVDLANAQELPYLPVHEIMETEAADVEVCQDFICNKLREEILIEASKCRPLASFKRRRMRVRRSRAANSCKLYRDNNFKMSKGKCSAAIRGACERAGIDGQYLAVNAYDLHKKGLMEKAGFVNFIWKYDELNAPLGSVLIYVGGSGHRYGHVEVRVNPKLYCSDHCTEKAVSQGSAAMSRKYKLVGVYLPFTSSIQISASQARPSPLHN
ncbi:MAG: hypothetical protein AB7F86_11515 [Bdellovibrionales bacterium]